MKYELYCLNKSNGEIIKICKRLLWIWNHLVQRKKRKKKEKERKKKPEEKMERQNTRDNED